MQSNRQFPAFILYALWALCTNEINIVVVKPLVQDFQILGVTIIVIVLALWVLSIPVHHRKQWIGYTLFTLLLGQLFLHAFARGHGVPEVILGACGLFITAWAFTRLPPYFLLISALFVFIEGLYPFSAQTASHLRPILALLLIVWILAGFVFGFNAQRKSYRM